MRYSLSSLHKLHLVLLIIKSTGMCNTSLSMEERSLMDHINHLLDESCTSGFAFSDGVLICCVSSVVMKIDNDTQSLHHNVEPLTLSSLLLVYIYKLIGLPDLNQRSISGLISADLGHIVQLTTL